MNQIAEFFGSIGFKVDTSGADKFNDYLNAIEKRIRAVRTEAVKLNKSLQSTTRVKGALNNIQSNRAAGSAATQISNLNSAATAGAAKIESYSGKLNKLAGALDKVAISAAKVHLPQGNITVRAPGQQPGRPGNRRNDGGISPVFDLGGMFAGGGFIRNMMPLAGASFAAALIKSSVQTGRAITSSEIAIRGASENPQVGKENVAFARTVANDLGMPLKDSLEQFGKLIGSSAGSGIDNQQVQNIFKGISEFGTARQIDPERMQLALRAVGQMMSKQKVAAEELKNQFAEHMPGGLNIAARSMGMDVPSLLKMMEDGKLMAKDLLPKMAEEFARAARENDALTQALATSRVAQGQFNNKLTDLISKIYQKIDPILARLFNNLSRIVDTIDVDFLTDVLKALLLPLEAVTSVFAMIGKSVASIVSNSKGISTGGWIASITLLLTSLGAITAFLGKSSAVAAVLRGAFILIGGKIGLIVAIVLGLVAVIEDIMLYITSDGQAQTVTGKILEYFDKIFTEVINWVQWKMGLISEAQMMAANANAAAQRQIDRIPEGIRQASAPVASGYSGTLDAMLKAKGVQTQNIQQTFQVTVHGNMDKTAATKMTDVLGQRPPTIPKG